VKDWHMGFDIKNDKRVTPRVSVVVVTYRSTKELPACVESLLQQSIPLEIFLVDNASPDATPQMVADYAARLDNVDAILNRENLGLAAGNNCALGRCRGEYVLILNPDTVLPADSLERMITFLDAHQDVGVLGPKCVYEDGTPHVSFHRNWGIHHVLAWRMIPYRFIRRLYDRLSPYKSQDVLFVSGACLLIRRHVFEQIGGYDPEYFLTVEDAADLCIRANRTGYRTVFFSEAQVLHYTGRSATQTPYLVVWEGIRGTVYHFLKHKGRLQALLISVLLGLSAAARVVTAGIFSIASARYRAVARIYGLVLRDLFLRNPIRVRRATGHVDETFTQTPLPASDHAIQTTPRVHTILVNWNNYTDTATCLSSLRQLSYANYDVIVVDNGSTDDSAARLRDAFPDLNIIELGRNLGFAGGCNAGIRFALSQGSDFVWLLNIDTTVDRDALRALVDKARSSPRLGACGSAIYFMDDPQRLQAWGGGHVNFWLGRSRHFIQPVPDESVEFITGASMLISRTAIESIGLLDEYFFMYWEDADYCFRLRASGWDLAVAGQSRVWHKGSSSVGKESAKLDRYFNASAKRFFRKHAAVSSVTIWTGGTLRFAKRLLRGDWTRARAVLAGILARQSNSRPDTGGRNTTLEADQTEG
jgi:GT2 family glycosyltransferase